MEGAGRGGANGRGGVVGAAAPLPPMLGGTATGSPVVSRETIILQRLYAPALGGRGALPTDSLSRSGLYERNSPVHHADKVKAPLLIFQGLDDRRVPPRQSEEMIEAMQKAGKHVEYVEYVGEGHGWRMVDTVRDYLAKMEGFLQKYVIER